MRVSIHVRWFSVSCPTSVSNADCTAYILAFTKFLQVCNLSFGLKNIQLALVVQQSNSGTVITSVFQTMQTLYQNRKRLLRTYVSYYSTHKRSFFLDYFNAKLHKKPIIHTLRGKKIKKNCIYPCQQLLLPKNSALKNRQFTLRLKPLQIKLLQNAVLVK